MSLITDAFSSLADIGGAYGTPTGTTAAPTSTGGFGGFISNLMSGVTSLGSQYLKTEAAQAQTQTAQATAKTSWYIFAAIAGGVVLLVVILFFAVRRH